MPSTSAPMADALTDIRTFRMWSGPGLVDARQHHDHHELIIPIRGGYQARTAMGLWSAHPGQVVVYPAGLEHQPQFGRKRGLSFLVVQWRGGVPPPPGVGADREGRIRILAEWMIETGDQAGPRAAADLALVMALVRRALDDIGNQGQADHAVALICQEMRGKLEAPLTLHELARLAGCSPQHLIRRFRLATGLSPMAWYQDQRLHEARRLLDDGVPGDEAARRCGYRHHRNLLRALRRHGLRP